MKRLFIVIVFAVSTLTGKTQQLPTHKSLFVYRFEKLNIILANEFMTNSSVKVSPQYVQFPFNENVFNTYGPFLKIMITDLTNPFRDSLVAGALSIDTSTRDGELMKLADLQVKITVKNNLHFQEWKDINAFPQEKSVNASPLKFGKMPANPGIFYVPVSQFIFAYDTVNVIIRNKRTNEELVHFCFRGIGSPVAPFLSMWTQDSSTSRSISSFIEHEVAGKESYLESINRFYKSWPRNYSGVLRNEKFYESSKLALYFRKAGPEYADSSMEYRIFSESDTDTSWIKTGHQLFITGLEPGNHYKLQIRYILHPENMQEHTFYVVPHWYQTWQFNFIMGMVTFSIIFFVALFIKRIRLKEEKRKNNQLRQGLKSIRSQLNPHFVFNALSSIQGLINKNDIAGANHYLTEFSMLLRESLGNSDREMVPINNEIRLLDTYLTLEQLRFHFQYVIEVDETINKNAVEIPSLLLQPLIENAIKHGVALLNEKGMVAIRFQAKNKGLIISVSDNGNGFSESNITKGFGLKLTRDRIALLNKTLKGQPIYLNFEHAQNSGTTVHLSFENWL